MSAADPQQRRRLWSSSPRSTWHWWLHSPPITNKHTLPANIQPTC